MPSTGWRQRMALTEDRYTYRVTWSEEDSEHVGLCAEFPSLSWLASTPEAALKGIRSVVGDAVADMAASAEPRPEPLAAKQYSGRLVVRVPSGLHRRLALEAAEAGVSLNRLASAKLILQPYLVRGRSPTAPKRLTGRSQRAANPRDSRRPVGPGSGGVRRPSPSTKYGCSTKRVRRSDVPTPSLHYSPTRTSST